MIITLRKPIKLNGEDVNVLDLELDKITPQDIIDSENEVIRASNMPVVLDFNRDFCITIAGKALNMPPESLKLMHVKDFNKIISEVRNFLADTDSEQPSKTQD